MIAVGRDRRRSRSVHFEWVLDTAHGADYFRRWHRDKANSGGLLVHKASHHFDLVNWWLADAPSRVYARGGLRFYGDGNADARGLAPARRAAPDDRLGDARGQLDLRADPRLKALYLDNEPYDGYLPRPGRVRSRASRSRTTLALIVDYRRGARADLLAQRALARGRATASRSTAPRAGRSSRWSSGGGDRARRGRTRSLDPSATRIGRRRRCAPEGERLLVQRHWERRDEVPIPAASAATAAATPSCWPTCSERHPGDDPLGRPADVARRRPGGRGRHRRQPVAGHGPARRRRRPEPRRLARVGVASEDLRVIALRSSDARDRCR